MRLHERKTAEYHAKQAEREAARAELLARVQRDAPELWAFLEAIDAVNRARGETAPRFKTRIRKIEWRGDKT
jgi:hypothetical protein